MGFAWEFLLILGLILANGCLVAAEIAIMTARRSRLEQRSQEGDRRAEAAAELAREPANFLLTVQMGVTFVATLAAAFAGAQLTDYLAGRLATASWPLLAGHARATALAVIALGISVVSLVLGQLVPKRLALANAERLARQVACPMRWLSRLCRPLTWVISTTAEIILRLLGQQGRGEPAVSLEDIERMLMDGTSEGIIKPAEQLVASKALRLGDRMVKEIMRPRIDIDALDVDTPPDEVIGAVAMAGFSRLPVHEGDLDHIIGFVYTKDLLRQQHMGWPIEIRKLVRPALLVPETMRLDKLLEEFRAHRTQMALVLDEFGGTEGLVTMEDVVEELIGEIHDEHRQDRPADIVRRDDASWLVDGRVSIESFLLQTGLDDLRLDDLRTTVPRQCNSLGGLLNWQLDRIARLGDRIEWRGLQLEVVSMDGPRVGHVLVTILNPPKA